MGVTAAASRVKAYSTFLVKSVDEEQRTLAGIATSPSTDRYGDIVEPAGAEFTLPLPFLWQHNAREPIGHVISASIGDDGINVRVQLARTDEPGELKNLLDKAWQSIKLGLVRGLSIGFRPLESSDIKDAGGDSWFPPQRYIRWEWLELSAVTIPANIDATIQTVKSYDRTQKASPGRVVKLILPGASGTSNSNSRVEVDMTTQERIRAFEATRAAKHARMNAIEDEAGKRNETKTEAEQEEFDTLADEIEKIDKALTDLQRLEKLNLEKAAPVNGRPGVQNGSDSRAPSQIVKVAQRLEPGIEFARYAMCLVAAKGNRMEALQIAESRYPDNPRIHTTLKAAVAAGTTTDSTWASPLVDYQNFAGDFVEFLRPETIIGKFGMGGVPALRSVPFNVNIIGQTSGGTAYWVGQGKPKPVTKFDFSSTPLGMTKLAAISVITEELARSSTPSAERLVRDSLRDVIVAKMDSDFVDPAVAAVSNVSPASITNGVSASSASGTDGDAVRTDVGTLWAPSVAANLPVSSAVYITTPTIALVLSLAANTLGQREFPDMRMTGGTLGGVPVITSNHVPSGYFILVFASEIHVADDGQVVIDVSREAALQMDDSPTNASAPVTATSMVSLWQTNSIGIRAERFINWAKRRSQAVAVLDNVGWFGATIAS